MRSRATGRVGRPFLAASLLVCLLLAGVVSYHASAEPDGLNRVAADRGFAETEEDSAAAGSPFADYGTSGVEDERLSGALAGVFGVTLTFATGGALFWMLRRRGPRPGHQRAQQRAQLGDQLRDQP